MGSGRPSAARRRSLLLAVLLCVLGGSSGGDHAAGAQEPWPGGERHGWDPRSLHRGGLAAGGMDRDGGPQGLAAELARQYLPLPIRAHSCLFQNRNAIEAFLFAYAGIIFWGVAWLPSGWSCAGGCTAPE